MTDTKPSTADDAKVLIASLKPSCTVSLEHAQSLHLSATALATTISQEQTTTPIFGSASTFGAGGGFAAFTGAPVAKADDADGDAGDGDEAAAEEECKAEFKPVVQLDEVETTTGEEEENLVADLYVGDVCARIEC